MREIIIVTSAFLFVQTALGSINAAIGQEQDKKIEIQVVDENGRSMPEAKIHIGIWLTENARYRGKRDFVTDENGGVSIPLPTNLRILRVWTSKPDYVRLFTHWEQAEINQVPKTFSIQMQRGTALSGTIVDEKGNSVVGATVEIMRKKGGNKLDTNPQTQLGRWLAEGDEAATTNKEGKWMIKNAPAGDDLEVSLMIRHPDFIKDEMWGALQSKQFVETSQMRDGSAKLVLIRGTPVHGIIVDDQGNPVPNALVVWSDQPYRQTGSQEVITDEQGKFRIPPRPDGELPITVVAKGWMPYSMDVDVKPGKKPLQIKLQKGKKLWLKFVDKAGNPVPNVYVSIRKWRQRESLYNHQHPNVIDSKIPFKSDENGEFIWDWAPEDPVEYSMGNPSLAYFQKELSADGTMQKISLFKALRIFGNVTDAKTGKPIKSFDVAPVTEFPGRPNDPIVQRYSVQPFEDGQYNFTRTHSLRENRLLLQFEALGYRTKRIGTFSRVDEDVERHIALEPAANLRGRVVDPKGKPVKQARVYRVTKDDSFIVSNTDYQQFEKGCTTGIDGVFEFPATFQPPMLVAVHQQGYAEAVVKLDEQPGDLVLQPWARVEGQVIEHGKPIPNCAVILAPIRMLGGEHQHVQDIFWAHTDKRGKFVFDRVPPVPSTIKPHLSVWREHPITSGQCIPLDLKPGETRRLRLGGNGVTVTGRVQTAGKLVDKIDLNYCLNFLLKNGPGIEPPDPVKKLKFDWEDGWSFNFFNSTEGKAYLSTLPHYFVRFQRDGTFSISGVPPGKYQFAIQVYEPPEGCLIDPVGLKVFDFEVTREDELRGKLELKTIKVDVTAGPQVGEAFPNFRVDAVAGGKSLSPDKFKGKFLLIDFWATWCAPCLKSFPELEKLDSSYDRSQFQLLSISLDQDASHLRSFLDEKKLGWQQGMLGQRDGPLVRRQLGISSVPTYCLIDRNGKLLYRGPKLQEAMTLLERAINQEDN